MIGNSIPGKSHSPATVDNLIGDNLDTRRELRSAIVVPELSLLNFAGAIDNDGVGLVGH